MRWLALTLCAGCGRVAFDPLGNGDGGVGTLGDAQVGLRIGDSAVRDTYLRNWQTTDNFGGAPVFSIEGQGGQTQVALIAIDMSSVPSSVVAAELHLWIETGAPLVVDAHQILEEWDEGDLDHEAGESNWMERKLGQPWATPGVGAPGSSVAAVEFSIVDPTLAGTEIAVSLPSLLVNGWIQDPASNHGLLLETSSSDEVIFHSSEASAALRPYLLVVPE